MKLNLSSKTTGLDRPYVYFQWVVFQDWYYCIYETMQETQLWGCITEPATRDYMSVCDGIF